MKVGEHMNEHLIMQYHEARSAELMAEARQERLKREILRQAASEKQATRLSLWQTLSAQLRRIHPAGTPPWVRGKERVSLEIS